MNRLGAAMLGVMLMGVGLFFRFNADNMASSKGSSAAIADIANIFMLVGLAATVAGMIFDDWAARNDLKS